MWINLTLKTGTETTVDFAKVLYFNSHTTGSQIFFDNLITDAKGKTVYKSLIVREDNSLIARAIAAKNTK